MPVDQAKEAAKVVIETSGTFAGIWEYVVSGIGAGILGLLGYVRKLEKNGITRAQFKEHIETDIEKFDLLFGKHDKVLEKVSSIAESVARIEGKLDK